MKIETDLFPENIPEKRVSVRLPQDEGQGLRAIITTPSGEVTLGRNHLRAFVALSTGESVTRTEFKGILSTYSSYVNSTLDELGSLLDPTGDSPIIKRFVRIRDLQEKKSDRVRYKFEKGVRIV